MNYKLLLLISIIIIYCYVNMNTYEGMTCEQWDTRENTECPTGKVLTEDIETDHPDNIILERGQETCCIDPEPPSAEPVSINPPPSADPVSIGTTSADPISINPPPSDPISTDVSGRYSFITNVSETQMDQLKDYIRYLRCD